jgi:hypothetical protein
LLDLPEVPRLIGPFDEAALCYPWSHPDPQVDRLCEDILTVIKQGVRHQPNRAQIFRQVLELAHAGHMDGEARRWAATPMDIPSRPAIPFLSEPWFC